ncbi:Rab-GTPase-TBC_domain-containing protein [Hexamita inflata]|uniref:Rab-GTPase-TBC domain-containing protein n=1 Tax=Hexamita inflata TaxID=28002 RepID=A0AA86URT1_9EUKA|nr:Rab-GTPase-TBC domain-containing protein [Hexamita inflata]
MSCINKYLPLQRKQLAQYLISSGVPDAFTRVFAWLRIFGFIDNQPETMIKQLNKLINDYFKLKNKVFKEFTPEPELEMRERFMQYVNSQALNSKIRDNVRKDVLRIMPDEPYFKSYEVRTAIFRLTYLLTQQLNTDHCQGFDDIIAVVYYVCIDGLTLVQQLIQSDQHLQRDDDDNPDSDFRSSFQFMSFINQHLLRTNSLETVSEAIAFQIYRHIISLTLNWFTDQESSQNTQSLKQITDLTLKVAHEICPQLHTILNKLDVPPELFVCRIARTLFSRELPVNQLINLWDFIFFDGFLNNEALRSVPEFVCIIIYNTLQQFICDDFDLLVIQQKIFESNPYKEYKEDLWRIYVSQLQYITQQTNRRFEVPVYAKHKFQIESANLRQMFKRFYYTPDTRIQKTKTKQTERQKMHEQLQMLQLDAAGFLDQLVDQLQVLKEPNADLFSCLASLTYFEQILQKYEPGNYSAVAESGTQFQKTLEKEIELCQNKITQISMRICDNKELLDKVVKNAENQK